MAPTHLSKHLPTDPRVVVGIIIALLVVVMMIAALATWTNIKTSHSDFEKDCAKLGGAIRTLGDETLCMIGNQVIGRHE
jgi:hypothetical protein